MASRSVEEYIDEVGNILLARRSDQIDLSFDELSDTLYMSFSDRSRFATNVYVGGGWMVRVDRSTDEVLGIQVENVLSHVADKFPFLVDLVMLTEPVGYSPSIVELAARRVASHHQEDAFAEFRDAVPTLAFAGD